MADRDSLKRTRSKAFVWTSTALAAGALATFLMARVLTEKRNDTPVLATVSVVVATADIPADTIITDALVEVVQWPAQVAPPNAFPSTADVIGRKPREVIYAREPVLSARLASDSEAGSAGLSATIPTHLRAMSIAVNEVVGVAGFLRPRDLVDVIAVMAPNTPAGDVQPHSRVILQAISVLAVGARLNGMFDADEKLAPHPVTVATLLVTPEESESLALAADRGQIWLALRGPIDDDLVETTGVDHASLVQSPTRRVRLVRRAAPPDSAHVDVVEVFRGAELEERKIRRASVPTPAR